MKNYGGSRTIVMLPLDFSSNCIGRTVLFADMLSRFYEVYIIGSSTTGSVWEPVRDKISTFNYSIYKSGSRILLLNLFKNARKLLTKIADIRPDAIYAFKPLPSSYGVGLLYKLKKSKIPLILDVDDWELGLALSAGWKAFPSLLISALMENSIRMADALTVSSHFLRDTFGGCYIPHAVDTDFFDPSKYNREKIREQLGVSEEAIISFIGTPRKHKGVDTIIFALFKLLKKEEDYKKFKFLFTGDPRDPYVKSLVNLSYGLLGKNRTLFLGLRPKVEEPHLLMASDIIVIPQKPTYASLGQVPAKVFTAMSMAKPIIASNISDLPIILKGCGILVPPGDVNALTDRIAYLMEHPEVAFTLGRQARIKCLKEYSYAVIRKKLRAVVNELLR